MDLYLLCLVLTAIPFTNAAVPGTFFWKPRLGLDLAIPTTQPPKGVNQPNSQNVRDGLVVYMDGYQAGMTIVALAAGISSGIASPALNPFSAYFYTNSYRWALRHFSLMPFWLGGNGGAYCDTHKVWRRRFFYMDEFVPKWLRYLFPYVKKEEWETEEQEFKRFKKYAEPAFGKHYKYPSKVFNNFLSNESDETAEELDSPSSSLTE